jgi:hypothetical protein
VRRIAFALAVATLTAAGVVATWRTHGAPRQAPVRVVEASLHTRRPHGVHAPEAGPLLPPRIEHGLAHRLRQYPALFLATAAQRAAADRLRRQLYAAARRFADPAAAARAGFDLRRPRRARRERRVMWFHAENRRWHAARDATLQPDRPDTLIYADLPGRPLELVGVMISMPRGMRGPTPGGPITRWHYHLVCVSGTRRGLAPRANGSCPAGARLGVGSEMMHVWFTRDLRSAYAIHAPWPELCGGHLLPADTCASGERFSGM